MVRELGAQFGAEILLQIQLSGQARDFRSLGLLEPERQRVPRAQRPSSVGFDPGAGEHRTCPFAAGGMCGSGTAAGTATGGCSGEGGRAPSRSSPLTPAAPSPDLLCKVPSLQCETAAVSRCSSVRRCAAALACCRRGRRCCWDIGPSLAVERPSCGRMAEGGATGEGGGGMDRSGCCCCCCSLAGRLVWGDDGAVSAAARKVPPESDGRRTHSEAPKGAADLIGRTADGHH